MFAMWQIDLIQYSLKKREKISILNKWLQDCSNNLCLDLGSARGTISYLLRQRGGTWISTDLDWINLVATRDLVSTNVLQINDVSFPFKNATFDKVISVDFLEHIEDDTTCISEIARIIKPGGVLIIGTPATGRKLLLNAIKPKLGLTLDTYGHVREGYSPAQLRSLLENAGFAIKRIACYSYSITETIEMLFNAFYIKLQKNKTKKRDGYISPASKDDYLKYSFALRIYKILYPLMWWTSRLDFFLKAFGAYAFLLEAEKTIMQRNVQEKEYV